MTSSFYLNLLHFIEQMNLTCLLDKISCRICAGCNTEISPGKILRCMDAIWHAECFRCHACNLPIKDREVRLIWVNWNLCLELDNEILESLTEFPFILVVHWVILTEISPFGDSFLRQASIVFTNPAIRSRIPQYVMFARIL